MYDTCEQPSRPLPISPHTAAGAKAAGSRRVEAGTEVATGTGTSTGIAAKKGKMVPSPSTWGSMLFKRGSAGELELPLPVQAQMPTLQVEPASAGSSQIRTRSRSRSRSKSGGRDEKQHNSGDDWQPAASRSSGGPASLNRHATSRRSSLDAPTVFTNGNSHGPPVRPAKSTNATHVDELLLRPTAPEGEREPSSSKWSLGSSASATFIASSPKRMTSQLPAHPPSSTAAAAATAPGSSNSLMSPPKPHTLLHESTSLVTAPAAPYPYPDPPKGKGDEDLVLDLDGLDLGPYGLDQGLSQSSWRSSASTSAATAPGVAPPAAARSKRNMFGLSSSSSVSSQGGAEREKERGRARQTALFGAQQLQTPHAMGEDSFTQHLRDQCPTSRDFFTPAGMLRLGPGGSGDAIALSSGVLIGAGTRAGGDGPVSTLSEPVLGGFASLGISDPDIETDALMYAREASLIQPQLRQRCLEGQILGTKELELQGEAGGRSVGDADGLQVNGIGTFQATAAEKDRSCRPSIAPSPWGFLQPKTSNPIETLDILSIEDMGLHSIDVGSAEDWQGCVLQNSSPARNAGSWAVARHMKARQQKWIVAPSCAHQQKQPVADQERLQEGECDCGGDCLSRTVIVSTQKCGAGDDLNFRNGSNDTATTSDQASAAMGEHHRSTFSGQHTFELRLLSSLFTDPSQFFVLSFADVPAAPDVGAMLSSDGYSLRMSPSAGGKSVKAQVASVDFLAPAIFTPHQELPDAGSARSSNTVMRDPESRRPSLGKSVSHESVGVTPRATGIGIGGASSLAAHAIAARSSLPNTPLQKPMRMTGPSPLPPPLPGNTDSSDTAPTSASLECYAFPESLSRPSTLIPDLVSPNVSPRIPPSPVLSSSIGSSDASPKGGQKPLPEPFSPRRRTISLLREQQSDLSREVRLREYSNATAESSSQEESVQTHPSVQSRTTLSDLQWSMGSPVPSTATSLYRDIFGLGSFSTTHLPVKKGKREAKFKMWFKRRILLGEDDGRLADNARLDSGLSDYHSQSGRRGDGEMSTFGRQGAIESARKGDWSAAATASSKSMDDLALLLASQRGIVSPLRQQPLRMVPASTVPPAAHAPSARHGLDFDDIRKSVFKSWGIQSASDPSKLQATATSRAGSYTGGLHPLKMFLPIPLASGLPGGPKRLRKLKVSFIPFASESSMQTPETTVKPSHTSMGSRSSQSSAKLTPHLAGNEFAAMPRSPASPRRGGSRWPHEVCRVPSRSVNIDAFRINAQVLLPPGETSCKDGSLTDDGLPEPMSFPVVLAVCDSQRNLELFPEGWAALGLGGGPIEAEAKPEELATNPKFESVHPMLGVTDLIIAGCAAIMDL